VDNKCNDLLMQLTCKVSTRLASPWRSARFSHTSKSADCWRKARAPITA
jgi:hypothetical protein